MRKILITGATGNIGAEVIKYLFGNNTGNHIIAGVRDIPKAIQLFPDFKNLEYRNFDFEDPGTFNKSLENIDCVFLLRPPHISDVEKYFKPLIQKITGKGIKQIVFLSVQGAEKSKVIPHNKIERLILESGIDHIFLRPAYFMQNLTTTLLKDIRDKRQIILPAGKAKFNWIDVTNIGEAAAILLDNFELYKNKEIELTGSENLNFFSVAETMSQVTGIRIDYVNVNPFRFFRIKKQEGLKPGLIIVMIMLHFIPRFQKEPEISGNYEFLTKKKPTSLQEFVAREKSKWREEMQK